MEIQNDFDVIIVGAGAAGLMGALELALVGKKAGIIEAKDRAGGRISTINDQRFELPVETGAEFIHGNLKVTLELLKKANINKQKVGGEFWRHQDGKLEKEKDINEDYSEIKKKFKELENDISVAEFLNTYLKVPQQEETRKWLQSFVESYYAANVNTTSTFALRDELEKSDEVQYRPAGGYKTIVDYLLAELKMRNIPVYYNTVVTNINWKKDNVEIVANAKIIKAKKVLLTVPLGVLQAGAIQFAPSLPEKMNAAKSLGFGNVIKLILQFDEAFWKDKKFTSDKDLSEMGFIFSAETIPTWWTQLPNKTAMLTGWLAGPNADQLKNYTDEKIMETALQSLCNLFGVTIAVLRQKLKAAQVANWGINPYSYGAYSFTTVGDAIHKKTLKQPADGTIFFAGEGLYEGIETGTVEAALANGRETAHNMIANF